MEKDKSGLPESTKPTKEISDVSKILDEFRNVVGEEDDENSMTYVGEKNLTRFGELNVLSDKQIKSFRLAVEISNTLNDFLLEQNPTIPETHISKIKETILSTANNVNALTYFMELAERIKNNNQNIVNEPFIKSVIGGDYKTFNDFLLSFENLRTKLEYGRIIEEISYKMLETAEVSSKGSILASNDKISKASTLEVFKYYHDFARPELEYLTNKVFKDLGPDEKLDNIEKMLFELMNGDVNIRRNVRNALEGLLGKEIDINKINRGDVKYLLASIDNILDKAGRISDGDRDVEINENEIRCLFYFTSPMNRMLVKLDSISKSLEPDENINTETTGVAEKYLNDIRTNTDLLAFAHSNELQTPVDFVVLKTHILENMNKIAEEDKYVKAYLVEKYDVLEKFLSDVLPEIIIRNEHILNSKGVINTDELYNIVHENRYKDILAKHGFMNSGDILPPDLNNSIRAAFCIGVNDYNKHVNDNRGDLDLKSAEHTLRTTAGIAWDFYSKGKLPKDGMRIYFSNSSKIRDGNSLVDSLLDEVDTVAKMSSGDMETFKILFPNIDFSEAENFNDCVKKVKDGIKMLKSMINLDLVKVYWDRENHQLYLQRAPQKTIARKKEKEEEPRFKIKNDDKPKFKIIDDDGARFKIIDDNSGAKFKIMEDDSAKFNVIDNAAKFKIIGDSNRAKFDIINNPVKFNIVRDGDDNNNLELDIRPKSAGQKNDFDILAQDHRPKSAKTKKERNTFDIGI